MPLLSAADSAPMQAEVYREEPRRYVVIEREGRPSVVIMGSEKVLARDDLVGTWQVAYLERDGESRPDLAGELLFRFSRGRLELMQRGRPTIVVAYDLEVADYPRRFRWILKGCGWTAIQKGVYWLDGDTLALCVGAVNKGRATEFLTQPHDGRTLFLLQRVKPEDEKRAPAKGQ
jgi:uncharacterized protein (TIGR03067 family)